MNKDYIFNKVKNIILFIYDYECQLCGHGSIQNHVHHLDRNHQNNDAYNLAPVCDKCHKMIHKSHIKFKPYRTNNVVLLLDNLNKHFCNFIY